MFVAINLVHSNGLSFGHFGEKVEVAGIFCSVLLVKMDPCESGKDVGSLSWRRCCLIFSVLAENFGSFGGSCLISNGLEGLLFCVFARVVWFGCSGFCQFRNHHESLGDGC